jgi:hypothetical protein
MDFEEIEFWMRAIAEYYRTAEASAPIRRADDDQIG